MSEGFWLFVSAVSGQMGWKVWLGFTLTLIVQNIAYRAFMNWWFHAR